MSETHFRLGGIRYNPATESFETLVTLERPDGQMLFPVSLPGHLDTEPKDVVSGLRSRAAALAGTKLGLLSRIASKESRRTDVPMAVRSILERRGMKQAA